MRNSTILIVVLGLLALISYPALAHDQNLGSIENPIEISDWAQRDYIHLDQDPWKGWAFVFVQNTSEIAWGDFHFKIFSYDGSDVSNVDFRDVSLGGMDPISTQTLDFWTIDNDVVGAELSLYFYGDPVLPGQYAQFQVWTDNTTDKVDFGLCIWPSPVPEPSSLLVLSGSLMGMAGLAWRRRK